VPATELGSTYLVDGSTGETAKAAAEGSADWVDNDTLLVDRSLGLISLCLAPLATRATTSTEYRDPPKACPQRPQFGCLLNCL
jgi:hypothetical protein